MDLSEAARTAAASLLALAMAAAAFALPVELKAQPIRLGPTTRVLYVMLARAIPAKPKVCAIALVRFPVTDADGNRVYMLHDVVEYCQPPGGPAVAPWPDGKIPHFP